MDYIATPHEVSRLFHHCSGERAPVDPTTIRRMCLRGDLVAQKIGSRWLINVTKSFPGLKIEIPSQEEAGEEP